MPPSAERPVPAYASKSSVEGPSDGSRRWTDSGSRAFWLTIRPNNSALPLPPESDLAGPAAPSISRRLRSWSALISLLLNQTVDWLTSGAPAPLLAQPPAHALAGAQDQPPLYKAEAGWKGHRRRG